MTETTIDHDEAGAPVTLTAGGVTVDLDADALAELAEAARHSVTVNAAYLIRAIKAVLPHTTGMEGSEQWNRIRLQVGGAGNGSLELLGCSNHTAIIVRVDDAAVDQSGYVDPFYVDLWPGDLANVARLFKPPKDVHVLLRIDDGRDDRVRITDVSGLPGIDLGRSYVMPTIGQPEHDTVPDVRAVILRTMRRRYGITGCVTYSGTALGRWADTAAAYKLNAVIEPTREAKPFVVTVGDHCIGLLLPVSADDIPDRAEAKIRGQWRTWLSDGELPDTNTDDSDENGAD